MNFFFHENKLIKYTKIYENIIDKNEQLKIQTVCYYCKSKSTQCKCEKIILYYIYK